jgi:glycosyltransferase involved in cell wall biosynthesis
VTGGVGLRLEEYCFEDRQASRRRLSLPAGAQVILCLGRQIEYKGMDRVLAAGAELHPSHPNLLIVIAGPETEWSRNVMARYADATWVRNLGSVSPDDKLAALSAADAMVMPSHGEALGITYLESWLAERPVIGLAKGAVQGLISHGQDGLLVPPGDQAALTAALAELLAEPERAAAMGRSGRAKVLARYTLDRITDIIEDAY